jgi:type IV pilus assembly protein PilB
VLVDLAFMDEDQLWDVLEEARASGERTGAAAVRLGLLTPEELRQALAEQRRRREQGPA